MSRNNWEFQISVYGTLHKDFMIEIRYYRTDVFIEKSDIVRVRIRRSLYAKEGLSQLFFVAYKKIMHRLSKEKTRFTSENDIKEILELEIMLIEALLIVYGY